MFCEPVQVPGDAVRVLPAVTVPLIVGATVFVAGGRVTAAVWVEKEYPATAEPTALVRRVPTRKVLPSSVSVTTKVDDVAPEMSTHWDDDAS